MLAGAIRARAQVARVPRQYMGLFEFAVWCWLRRRNIRLNIGRNWVSLEEWFPRLQERARCPDSQPPIHIAAAIAKERRKAAEAKAKAKA